MLETLKRFGITTGAAAAAAAKAAALAMRCHAVTAVVIPTPVGLRIEVPVERTFRRDYMFCAEVRKFSGDNPDVLDGVEVISCVKLIEGSEVVIRGGRGVGVATRDGVRFRRGESAISPAAAEMIRRAVREVIGEGGVLVLVEVPRGEELAEKTMNQAVGIRGGISILGTTGIEAPVSDEDYVEHIRAEMEVIASSGTDVIVIAPGNTGALYASKIFSEERVVKAGDRIGDAVRLALEMGFKKVVLAGLPGKLVKVAAGMLNTHSSLGDARIEILTHAAVMTGVPPDVVKRVAASLTVEEALSHLGEHKCKVMEYVAERILERLRRLGSADFEVVIFDYSGNVLARRSARGGSQ